MASNIEFLKKQGDELFNKRLNLLNLWQTIADNFYPERADFTTIRSLGDQYPPTAILQNARGNMQDHSFTVHRKHCSQALTQLAVTVLELFA